MGTRHPALYIIVNKGNQIHKGGSYSGKEVTTPRLSLYEWPGLIIPRNVFLYWEQDILHFILPVEHALTIQAGGEKPLWFQETCLARVAASMLALDNKANKHSDVGT